MIYVFTHCQKIQVNGRIGPEILNSNQGVQFTRKEYISYLKSHKIRISMDSKGRALDNIYIERFCRTIKYQHIYLNPADNGLALLLELKKVT